MDPLTILGLVSNIVQLADAAKNAVVICHQIYKQGAAIEDSQMSYTNDQLLQCYTVLYDSLRANKTPNLPAMNSGIDLKDLASECCETAKLLHTELESLRLTHGGGVRAAFFKTIQRKLNSKNIDRLKGKLDEYQKTLETKVLVDIRQSLSILHSQQGHLSLKLEQQQLTKLSTDLEHYRIPVSNQFKVEVDKIIASNEQQQLITRQHAEEKYKQQFLRQREQCLESLTFPEIDFRMNEVSESHPRTFDWMFKENAKPGCDSFQAWLAGDEHVFWINGKAGSGKGTLMKFIANDGRTKDTLAYRLPKTEVLILTFWFWLSGSKMQRSMKGSLCSILRQIVLSDERLLEILIHGGNGLTERRSVGDWSTAELQKHLVSLVELNTHPICIFIDGIDEFDKEDDVDDLLSLVEKLSTVENVKICMSSRPENQLEKQMSKYKKLRLEDLTKEDMRVYVRDKLSKTGRRCHPASVSHGEFDRIVEIKMTKADGVFLWVHYALSSLLKGMNNQDDFKDLLNRIEELPSGIERLYLQMWGRLNGDEKRYFDEATLLFSYDSFYPISLFKLLVALDKDLQLKYVKNLTRQDHRNLVRRCEKLKTRILTRCAGLLEVVGYEDSNKGIDDDGTLDLPHQYEIEDDTDPIRLTFASSDSSPEIATKEQYQSRGSRNECSLPTQQRVQEYDELKTHYKTKVKYLHRTARDFLLDTTAGQRLVGKPKTSLEERFQNVTRARIASLIQGLARFSGRWIHKIVKSIGCFNPESEKAYSKIEIDLVTSVRRVYESRSSHNFQNIVTFDRGPSDFLGTTAFNGCTEYVRYSIENENQYMSPYYRGYLFLCAVDGPAGFRSRNWSLISWLAQSGADLFTKHWVSGIVEQPAASLVVCFQIFNNGIIPSERHEYPAGQITRTIQDLHPLVVNSPDKCLVRLDRSANWLLDDIIDMGVRYSSDGDKFDLLVEMSIAKLWNLFLQYCRKYSSFQSLHSFSLPQPPKEPMTKVIFRFSSHGNGACPNPQDAVYLGQALEAILLKSENVNITSNVLVRELESRLGEVSRRSVQKSHQDWAYDSGWKIKTD